MKQEIPKLKETWNEPITTGIFTALKTLNVPWANEILDTSINLDYYYGYSGEKRISPLLDNVLADGALTEASKQLLAVTAYNLYNVQWTKLYATLSLEYNPIDNYSMTEREDINQTGSEETGSNSTGSNNRTVNLNHNMSDTGTETIAHTGTIETESSANATGSAETNKAIYGFNSSTATGTDESNDTNTSSGTGTETKTYDNTDTTTKNLSHTETETGTDNVSNSSNTTGNRSDERETKRTLTRNGNIGVTTTQQMITSERELWIYNFLRDRVYSDLDKLLTLSVY